MLFCQCKSKFKVSATSSVEDINWFCCFRWIASINNAIRYWVSGHDTKLKINLIKTSQKRQMAAVVWITMGQCEKDIIKCYVFIPTTYNLSMKHNGNLQNNQNFVNGIKSSMMEIWYFLYFKTVLIDIAIKWDHETWTFELFISSALLLVSNSINDGNLSSLFICEHFRSSTNPISCRSLKCKKVYR